MSTGFASPTETLLHPYPVSSPFPACRYLCQSLWTCWSDLGRRYTWRQRSDALLATDEPFSVIAPSLRTSLDLVVSAEPGWTVPLPFWRGIACDVGRVTFWLPVEGTLLHRPFALLVLLPRQDTPDAPPYALLGVQFLIEYEVTVSLVCSQGGYGAGRLAIP